MNKLYFAGQCLRADIKIYTERQNVRYSSPLKMAALTAFYRSNSGTAVLNGWMYAFFLSLIFLFWGERGGVRGELVLPCINRGLATRRSIVQQRLENVY